MLNASEALYCPLVVHSLWTQASRVNTLGFDLVWFVLFYFFVSLNQRAVVEGVLKFITKVKVQMQQLLIYLK